MASPTRQLKPSSKPITAYYAALRAFAEQEVAHEQAVRAAFQTLITDAAKPFKWTAIPELGSKTRGTGKRSRVIPDGTLRDHYHLPRGHWEAKDSADNLDAEIAEKIKKGYPLHNTIFWTPARAVLFQNKQRTLDLDISDGPPGAQALCDLLNAFLTYTDKPILDFDTAVSEFSQRVPDLGKRLAELIADAHKTNRKFQAAFDAFFALCQTALNPNISRAAVDEMLIQHLLTERLFAKVFSNPEFVRRNVIAAEVEKVIDALTSRSFNRETFLSSLDRFYLAIENAAAAVTDFSDKQHFLNTVYERFFQGYCVKTADTHGIVYTPQPIVDFMCASVEHVLETEFGKRLGDDGVVILDPCTGTGNFVVNLMRRAAERGRKHLQRMYREQLFANEIMLLPYYIAALNIEHAYFEEAGEYEPFEGLCFVDTLELAEPKHSGLFTEANAERVTRQKNAPITVVIGNPPYNVGQMTHNEQNQNRPYPTVDQWVRATYGKDSAATSVSKLNDPYVKFFKWATRRLDDRDGIVCFVSNNAFIENVAYDGMRKHLGRDFQAIYHLDLEGNVRQNPTLSGTQYNVFGIQVGVGITVAVKRRQAHQPGIRYEAVDKNRRRYEKLAWLLSHESVADVTWRLLRPDDKHTWLVPDNAKAFAALVPIGNKLARAGVADAPPVVFRDYTLGIATHRDSIVYDFSRRSLTSRIQSFVDSYNTEVDRWKRAPKGSDINRFVRYDSIVWDRDLKNDVKRGRYAAFDDDKVRLSSYRPFCRQHLFMDRVLNAEVYGWFSTLPTSGSERENRIIWIKVGSEVPLFALCATSVCDLLTQGGSQCFPFYVYDEDGTNRRENITDWALKTFRDHYGNKKLTKWDIFHYVYAILYHPGYREKFADNLKRELPRIPFAPDFKAFAKAGEELANLHLNYDDEKVVKPHPLKEVWTHGTPKSYRVEKMKLAKDKASLTVNETLTLTGIPADAFTYRLGNRSALDWVIDQYQFHTDPRSGITSDPNAWGEERDPPDEEYIVRLVKQVVTVSLETNKLVRSLPAEFSSPDQSRGAPASGDEAIPADRPSSKRAPNGIPPTGSGFALRPGAPPSPKLKF